MVTNMTTASPPPTDRQQLLLGFLLADTLRLLRAEFARRTRGFPLTPALHRLLIYVERNPGCRQVELAEWLDVSPVTVGRMIDRLEKQGLVRREQHPVDRRASRVVVGEGARALLDKLNAVAEVTRERAFEGVSAAQREQVFAALERIRENLASVTARPLLTKRKHGDG